MEPLLKRWKQVPKAIRQPLIFMIGFAVVIGGIAMLVLPGPGWAAIFLGFAILATEFAFAEKVRDWLVTELKRLMKWGKQEIRKLFGKTKNKPKA